MNCVECVCVCMCVNTHMNVSVVSCQCNTNYVYRDDNWPNIDPSHVQEGADNRIHVDAKLQDRSVVIPDLTSNQSYDVRVYAKNADDKWSAPSGEKKDVMTSEYMYNLKHCEAQLQ